MPSFDVVSELDEQEIRNAVDQARRELSTRFDFKGTDSVVELKDTVIELESASEERLAAVVVVLQEKLVRRKVSLKALDFGKVEDALPAFVTLVLIPLTLSITQGILWGFLLHAVLYVVVGRAREVKPMLWGLAALSAALLVLEY